MKKDLVKTEMDVEITTEKIRLLKEKLSFDDFLSNKIGFGRYQYFAMLLMCNFYPILFLEINFLI